MTDGVFDTGDLIAPTPVERAEGQWVDFDGPFHSPPLTVVFGGYPSLSSDATFVFRAEPLYSGTASAVGEHLAGLIGFTLEGGSNEARTRQLVGRKMDMVWALKDGWQGPGSLAPTQIARDFYLAALQVLPAKCIGAAEPAPTRDGGLHMEWTGRESEYAAEITGDGQVILHVFAADEDDDSEVVIESPTQADLVDFICHGV